MSCDSAHKPTSRVQQQPQFKVHVEFCWLTCLARSNRSSLEGKSTHGPMLVAVLVTDEDAEDGGAGPSVEGATKRLLAQLARKNTVENVVPLLVALKRQLGKAGRCDSSIPVRISVATVCSNDKS
jgi:hypothetical protein